MVGVLQKISVGLFKWTLQVDIWNYRGAKKLKTVGRNEQFLRNSVASLVSRSLHNTCSHHSSSEEAFDAARVGSQSTSLWMHPWTLCGRLAWHWGIPGGKVEPGDLQASVFEAYCMKMA